MMNVNGSCHCGAISFRASVDPAKVNLCHCTDCQKLSGSPYRVSVPAAAGTFNLLSGNPRVYIKTAESGAKRAQAFCPDCGSPLFATTPGESPPVYMLRLGALAEREQLPPQRQIWCQSAMPWCTDIEGVPGTDRQ